MKSGLKYTAEAMKIKLPTAKHIIGTFRKQGKIF
jgi:hypothetical protein